MSNEDLGRDAHWFDGDGMLSGVNFAQTPNGDVQPQFVNQYILTDVFLSTTTTPAIRRSPIPSIATLVDPLASLLKICLSILRAVFLVILSRLPGSRQTIKKISVANTSILYHDGRALATCESGPPMRVQLPGLETVGWYNGRKAEGEPQGDQQGPELGGNGPLSFMREWITAHPKVDSKTNEMILYNSAFAPPYVHYSVIPADRKASPEKPQGSRLLNAPVAGISSPKMMHDFGVSRMHSIIMDLPLSLNPVNLALNRPSIMYDPSKSSRFGVFPRHEPRHVRWFETNACCIFHTANAWDVFDKQGDLESVDFLACRMTSATVVFAGGNIPGPKVSQSGKSRDPEATTGRQFKIHLDGNQLDAATYEQSPLLESTIQSEVSNIANEEEEQDRLYYYSFRMSIDSASTGNTISHEFALARIPFDFPSVHPDLEMSCARFVYGCSSTCSSFNSALGRTAKIDALVKVDTRTLIARGKANPPPPTPTTENKSGCVDNRELSEIVAAQNANGTAAGEPIQVFQTPPYVYAQEPRFVPKTNAQSEDDGYLVAYMFDERQVGEDGACRFDAASELWIVDAKSMRNVVGKVRLPQRVPYGFHGSWFDKREVLGQKAVAENGLRKARPMEEWEAMDGWRERAGRWVIDKAVRGIGG